MIEEVRAEVKEEKDHYLVFFFSLFFFFFPLSPPPPPPFFPTGVTSQKYRMATSASLPGAAPSRYLQNFRAPALNRFTSPSPSRSPDAGYEHKRMSREQAAGDEALWTLTLRAVFKIRWIPKSEWQSIRTSLAE